MRYVFALLRWLRAGRGSNSYLPAAPIAPDWTAQNARDLQQFLSSETGQVLLARARAMEYHVSVQCVRDASSGQIKVPTFSEAIAWLDSLSRAGGDQPATSAVLSGEDETGERQLAIA